MRSLGIVRKVDVAGRISIPAELRKSLKVNEEDPLEIYMEGGCIVLGKYKPKCAFCGEDREIKIYKDKNICKICLEELTSLI
ncbi:AbrB/MazE/SpoVT family DNA-binding domain-containing protein [Clostridium carnis]